MIIEWGAFLKLNYRVFDDIDNIFEDFALYAICHLIRILIFSKQSRKIWFKLPRKIMGCKGGNYIVWQAFLLIFYPLGSMVSSTLFDEVFFVFIHQKIIKISMNKIASLSQIKHYKAKILSAGTHSALSSTLRHFIPNSSFTHLAYTYPFAINSLPFLHEKMGRIGTVADEIDHHPEWTLKEGALEIRLSTHDIGNKVSLKDYVLATWIEDVLHGEEIQTALLRGWNGKKIQLEELE